MLDIDGLLSDLEQVILEVVSSLAEGVPRGSSLVREHKLGDDIKVTTSLKVGFLDEMLSDQTRRPDYAPEPLIDVIESKEGFKVIIMLPGIRKEDVKVSRLPRSLVFEISAKNVQYRKEIPCEVDPSGVAVKSMVANNSVVEISFARKGKGTTR